MISKLIPRTQAEKLTGLTLAEMYKLAHKGIITIIKINARNFKVPESDLDDIPGKILAYERQRALEGLGIQSERQKEIADELWRLYKYREA